MKKENKVYTEEFKHQIAKLHASGKTSGELENAILSRIHRKVKKKFYSIINHTVLYSRIAESGLRSTLPGKLCLFVGTTQHHRVPSPPLSIAK